MRFQSRPEFSPIIKSISTRFSFFVRTPHFQSVQHLTVFFPLHNHYGVIESKTRKIPQDYTIKIDLIRSVSVSLSRVLGDRLIYCRRSGYFDQKPSDMYVQRLVSISGLRYLSCIRRMPSLVPAQIGTTLPKRYTSLHCPQFSFLAISCAFHPNQLSRNGGGLD